MKKKHVYRFWGGMDLFLIIYYIFLNIYYYSPYYHIFSLVFGDEPIRGVDKIDIFLILIITGFYISIIISMIRFFKLNERVKKLTYIQIPFRLLCSAPSLSLVLLVLRGTDNYSAVSVFFLWVVSEVVKVLSIRSVNKA